MGADALRVLFVDADAAVTRRFADLLREDRHRFLVSVAASGAKAAKAVQSERFDAVVTAARLPDMDGAQLLGWTRRHRPASARIMLGPADAPEAPRARPPSAAQQSLTRGCDRATLRATLERACSLSRLLHDPAVQRAIGTPDQAPAMPKAYADLICADATLERVVALIQADHIARRFVLDLADAFPGAPGRKPKSLGDTIAMLGVETARAGMIAAHWLSGRLEGAPPQYTADRLRERAIRRAARAAEFLAGNPARDTGCAAALLADLGIAALLRANPSGLARALAHAKDKQIAIDSAERIVLGVDHGEAAAAALAGWSLPFAVLEAIAYHHRPGLVTEGERAALGAVHLADCLVDTDEYGEPDRAFLAAIGLREAAELLGVSV